VSVEDLRREVTEYSLRVEEVLGGMDRVLTDLTKRVAALERRPTGGNSPTGSPGDTIPARVQLLEEQIAAVGLVIGELLGGRE
jgi:hypothetical protein